MSEGWYVQDIFNNRSGEPLVRFQEVQLMEGVIEIRFGLMITFQTSITLLWHMLVAGEVWSISYIKSYGGLWDAIQCIAGSNYSWALVALMACSGHQLISLIINIRPQQLSFFWITSSFTYTHPSSHIVRKLSFAHQEKMRKLMYNLQVSEHLKQHLPN